MTDSQSDSCTISVVRTGGFAGLTRQWSVSTADAPEVDWAALIAACPWKTVARPEPVADGFIWRIQSRDLSATVADQNLTGPWSDLVDQVKSFAKR